MTYNMAEYFTCRQKFKAHLLNFEPKAQNDCELKAKSICLRLLYEFNGQKLPLQSKQNWHSIAEAQKYPRSSKMLWLEVSQNA